MSRLRQPIEFETTRGRYTASEIIGEGGTGRVYAATDDDGKSPAIRLLDPRKGASAERRKRFWNELQFGLRNEHRNVVTVIDHGIGQEGGKSTPFCVMPRYSSSLREGLKSGVSTASVLKQFAQILDGVEAAHLQGVVHRDLKPENILRDATSQQWIIADFGIANFTQEELYTLVETKPDTRLANFYYAAPEQRVRGAQTSCRTDIFALGLILNEMFTKEVAHGTGYRTVGSVAPGFAYVDELIDGSTA